MIVQTFFIPPTYSLHVLKCQFKWLYITNAKHILNWKLDDSARINPTIGCISLKTLTRNHHLDELSRLVQSCSTVNTSVVKFKGKGFKLVKKSGGFDFLFNFSHLKYLAPRTTILKKLTKNKLVLINWRANYLQQFQTNLVNVRAIDLYSANGWRLKRQIIYRRKGKTMTT